jgi:hypothetical protein
LGLTFDSPTKKAARIQKDSGGSRLHRKELRAEFSYV